MIENLRRTRGEARNTTRPAWLAWRLPALLWVMAVLMLGSSTARAGKVETLCESASSLGVAPGDIIDCTLVITVDSWDERVGTLELSLGFDQDRLDELDFVDSSFRTPAGWARLPSGDVVDSSGNNGGAWAEAFSALALADLWSLEPGRHVLGAVTFQVNTPAFDATDVHFEGALAGAFGDVTAFYEFVGARLDPVVTQCSDATDNDGDGLIDLADSDCADRDDRTEFQVGPGDILVAEGDGALLRVDPVSGSQTVMLSHPSLSHVFGLALDDLRGDLFVSQYGVGIRRFDLDTGALDSVSIGGLLERPRALAFGATGKLLVTDGFAQAVLGIDLRTGAQSIVADDTRNRFSQPEGLVVEADGSLLVSDWGGIGNIRRIDPNTGATDAQFSYPGFEINRRLALEANGNLLIVDSGLTEEIYRMDPQNGAIWTVTSGGLLADPYGIAVEADGGILVGSHSPGRLLRVDPVTGTQRVVATGGALHEVNGIVVAPPTQCSDGLDDDGDGLIDTADPDCQDPFDNAEYKLEVGDIVVAEGTGALVRIGANSGIQTVLVSSPTLRNVFGIGIDGRYGDLVFTHYDGAVVLRLDPERGELTTLASGGLISEPREVAFAADGRILVTDSGTDAILGIDRETGEVSIVAGQTSPARFSRPEGLVVEADGNLLVSDWIRHDYVLRIDPVSGETLDEFNHPDFDVNRRLALEANGDILVVDSGRRGQIYRMDPVTGAIETVSRGTLLIDPYGIDVDAWGDIIVTTREPGSVVRIFVGTQPNVPDGTQLRIATGGNLDLVSGVRLVPAHCIDGVDNDGDGAIDLADLGCTNSLDPFEQGSPDQDSDRVPDAFDNCIDDANPSQRDSDGDGYGNACDGDFNQDFLSVGFPDLAQMRQAIGKQVYSFDCLADDGSAGGSCTEFDLDARHEIIGFADLAVFRQLMGKPPGPKCEACPLP